MKKVLCALLSMALLLTAGCGKKKEETPVVAPELSLTSVNMMMGDIQKLSVLNYEGSVTWETSNASVAVVSETGDISALSEGSAVITANAEGAEKMSCVVSVSPGVSNIQSITVTSYYSSSSDITINYSDSPSALLRASCMPQSAGEKIMWASSNEAVATVDQSGNVTAHSNGTVSVSATALNGISGSCKIRVKNAPTSAPSIENETAAQDEQTTNVTANVEEEKDDSLVLPVPSPTAQARITLSDKEIYLSPAEDYQLECTVENLIEGSYVDWSSSKESVAVVKFGRVIGVGNGITVITAYTADGAVASCYAAVGSKAKKELKKMLADRQGD